VRWQAKTFLPSNCGQLQFRVQRPLQITPRVGLLQAVRNALSCRWRVQHVIGHLPLTSSPPVRVRIRYGGKLSEGDALHSVQHAVDVLI